MIWFLIVSILISMRNVSPLVPIGANVGGLADDDRKQPYVNLVKQARAWGSADKPWDSNCTFDPATGWLNVKDFGGIFASESVDIDGKYFFLPKEMQKYQSNWIRLRTYMKKPTTKRRTL